MGIVKISYRGYSLLRPQFSHLFNKSHYSIYTVRAGEDSDKTERAGEMAQQLRVIDAFLEDQSGVSSACK